MHHLIFRQTQNVSENLTQFLCNERSTLLRGVEQLIGIDGSDWSGPVKPVPIFPTPLCVVV